MGDRWDIRRLERCATGVRGVHQDASGLEHAMNLYRPKPKPGDDLELWLSGVVHDAVRDAQEAGLAEDVIADMLNLISTSVRGDGLCSHCAGTGYT
jgi:hypothetical protein